MFQSVSIQTVYFLLSLLPVLPVGGKAYRFRSCFCLLTLYGLGRGVQHVYHGKFLF